MVGCWVACGILVSSAAPAVSQVAEPSEKQAADDPVGYEIRLDPGTVADVGEMRSVSLTIAPRPGYSVSREGPLLVVLGATPATGLGLLRKRYQRRDAADTHAEAPRFDLRFRGQRAGRYTLMVAMRFWVCGNHSCRPIRIRQSTAVEIRPRAQPAPPDGKKS